MKQLWFLSLGVAAAISVSACSGAPASLTTAPAAPTSASPVATALPRSTVAPTVAPTTAPTIAPTTAPTTAPTVAPSPTAAATSTVAVQPTMAATASPQNAAVANTPVAGGPDVQLGDIEKVAQAWSQVKSFRIKSETGSESQFTGEFVAPDRNHITLTAGAQTFEVIQIGQDSYTKINGTWTKRTGTSSTMTFDPSKIVADFNDSKQSGKKLTKGATETVNGIQCEEWVSTDTNGTSTSLCVGLDNSLPIQATSADGKTTIDFYDYNAPISIQAPN